VKVDTNIRNRVFLSKPENIERLRVLGKELWDRPGYRENQVVKRIGKRHSPRTEFKRGQRSPRYCPIGSHKTWHGYVRIKVAAHGHADSNWQFEHILVVEQYIGRPIKKGEFVHHIDGDKLNNKISNLYLCSNSQHRKLHSFEKLLKPLLATGVLKFNADKGEYYV